MNSDLAKPLSQEALELLGDFLLDRVPEYDYDESIDEGVLVVPELDGFLTAIVSGPVMVPPSRWLPALWGDFEPEWEDEHAFEAMFGLLLRHMNDIAVTLMQQPEAFEPLYFEREVDGRLYLIVDEWCEGFARGMALCAEEWRRGGEEMEALLAPILAFTEQAGWHGHTLADEEMQKLQQRIAASVREIHAYWLRRRGQHPAGEPVRRGAPKIGRNDPCLCGSGRKYKHCCLH
jgi:uncharacterized protein